MKSRYKAILASTLIVLGFAILFNTYGYNATWELWNIPTMSPHFADLRTITHGAESFAQGFDPMIENPADPWNRTLNYPRVWQTLYLLGINQAHTTSLGLMIIFSFLIGVCLVLPRAPNITITLVFSAVLSPAILLGIERANIDLLMFFLASLSILAIQRSYLFSTLAILTGFILKLFPLFGWAVLLRMGKSKFFISTIIALICVSAYTLATFSDILLIRRQTPTNIGLSYGMDVFWMALSDINATIGVYAKVVSHLTVLLIFAFAFSPLFRNDTIPEEQNDTLYLDAFRLGSAIYVGTFLLGNNWDYRLMFLIFTLPQLILWIKRSVSISIYSLLMISVILISLWHLIIDSVLRYLPYGNYLSFVLDEMANWITFIGLVYLLIWSLPIWAKHIIHKPKA